MRKVDSQALKLFVRVEKSKVELNWPPDNERQNNLRSVLIHFLQSALDANNPRPDMNGLATGEQILINIIGKPVPVSPEITAQPKPEPAKLAALPASAAPIPFQIQQPAPSQPENLEHKKKVLAADALRQAAHWLREFPRRGSPASQLKAIEQLMQPAFQLGLLSLKYRPGREAPEIFKL